MGTIYKLEPKIVDFIVRSKQQTPTLSCRQLSEKIKEQFQLELSKSSVNKTLKNAGLSMPIGRRRTKRKYTLKERIAKAISGEITLPKKEPVLMLPAEEEKPELPEIRLTQEPAKEITEQSPQEQLPEETAQPPQICPSDAETEKPVAGPEEKPPVQPEEETITPTPPVEEPASVETPLLQPTEEKPLSPGPSEKEPSREPKESLPPPEDEPILQPQPQPAAEEPEKRVEEPCVISGAQPQEDLPAELECSGAILLKAADTLIGGSASMAEAIQNHFDRKVEDFPSLTEALIYLPMLEKNNIRENPRQLWALLGRKAELSRIDEFSKVLESRDKISLDMLKAVSSGLREIHCIKIMLSDDNQVYLDGQLQSVWSNPHIPFGFSSPLAHTKRYIERCFQNNHALALFMAAGYDTPTDEFFNFLLSFDSLNTKITKVALCGERLEEVQSFRLQNEKTRNYVFGMWPWQFTRCRKVKDVGAFKPYRHPFSNEEFFLADIELELTNPVINKPISFRGCSLKRELAGKVKLVILGNFPVDKPVCEIADIYLGRWPNIEEGFQNYSRKVELFTYTAKPRDYLSSENLAMIPGASDNPKLICAEYLKILDLYVRCYFLPPGWEDKTFPQAEKDFYRLNCRIRKGEQTVIAEFLPEATYPLIKELTYACHRINEKEVYLNEKRLWCLLGDGSR